MYQRNEAALVLSVGYSTSHGLWHEEPAPHEEGRYTDGHFMIRNRYISGSQSYAGLVTNIELSATQRKTT